MDKTAKKTTYMKAWRARNKQHYKDYQREYRRAYRAAKKATNEK